MKLNLLIITLIFLFSAAAASAQDYSVSNVVFDPPSPATLMPNERINFTFDYAKAGGDIRIFARSVKIAGVGNASSAGSPLYTENVGSGNAYFFYNNGATINGVLFSFKDVDGTLLYDTTVVVDFTYLEFNITDLELSPESPTALNFGDSVKFTFNYSIPDMDLLIVPMAYGINDVIQNQISSASPVYSDTIGSGTGFFRIDGLATVDKIRFQFLDASTNDTIVEVFWYTYFSFSNDSNKTYSISNVIFDPASPSSMVENDKVNITFDYQKPYGDVRIYIDPVKSSGSGNYGTSGSPIYSENNGSATDVNFTYFGEALVEKVIFRIQSASGGILLHEHSEDVHFSYSQNTIPYSITNVVFNPPSPSTIHTVDTLKFTFDYSKPYGNIKIFARPIKDGSLKLGSTSGSVITYTDSTGIGSDYISFADVASFDQIRFQIKSTLNQLLYETFVDVDYDFIFRPVSAELVETDNQPSIYPMPATNELTISVPGVKGFDYSIVNLSGQVIQKGFSESNTLKINVNHIHRGTYITQIKYADQQYSKLLIIE